MADQKISQLTNDTAPTEEYFIPAIKPNGSGGFDNVQIELAKLGQALTIPSANVKDSQVLATFTNSVNQAEIGSTVNNVTFNWTYNRAPDPTSQEINNGIGSLAVALRTTNITGAGLTTNTTWTISAVGDDLEASSRQTTLFFRPRLYAGVSSSILNNSSSSATFLAALTQLTPFATTEVGSYTLDASVGGGNNYLYIFYPTSFGLPSSTRIGGFAFTDYTVVTKVGFTNASGHSQDYYVLRTNSQYNSTGLVWQLL